jgi:hypothetical protein
MEKIFKKTIQFNIIALIALIISAFNEPYEVNQINETISSGIIDNEGSIGLLFGIIVVVYLIAYFVSLYFVYSFKKLGRKLYTITFVVGLVITLLSGPIVMGPISAFIHEIAVTFNGAILVFIFFTPLQKKFN